MGNSCKDSEKKQVKNFTWKKALLMSSVWGLGSIVGTSHFFRDGLSEVAVMAGVCTVMGAMIMFFRCKYGGD